MDDARRIYQFSYAKTRDAREAEDLSQEILLALFSARTEHVLNMDAYVRGVCRHVWARYLARNKPHWEATRYESALDYLEDDLRVEEEIESRAEYEKSAQGNRAPRPHAAGSPRHALFRGKERSGDCARAEHKFRNRPLASLQGTGRTERKAFDGDEKRDARTDSDGGRIFGQCGRSDAVRVEGRFAYPEHRVGMLRKTAPRGGRRAGTGRACCLC